MEIQKGIRPSCSEWNESVESDDNISNDIYENPIDEINAPKIKKNAEWDE